MTASRRRDHYVTEYGFPFILVLVNDSNSTSILCIFMMSPLLSFVRFYVSVHRCVGMEFGAIFITMEQNTIPRNLMLTFQNEMQQGHQIWSTIIVKPSLLCLFGNSTFYLNLKSIFHVIADFLSVQFLSMQMIVFVYDEKQREEEFNRKWNWSIESFHLQSVDSAHDNDFLNLVSIFSSLKWIKIWIWLQRGMSYQVKPIIFT